MATVLVRHKVNDYTRWKRVYDEGKKMVKSKGGTRQTLFKNSTNPNELVILTEVDGADQARQLVQSDELKQAMERGGVAEEPTVYVLERLEDVSL